MNISPIESILKILEKEWLTIKDVKQIFPNYGNTLQKSIKKEIDNALVVQGYLPIPHYIPTDLFIKYLCIDIRFLKKILSIERKLTNDNIPCQKSKMD